MTKQKKEIDWNLVEKRMEAGCNGIEISAVLRVDPDTFYRRFEEQYGKRFADISDHFQKAGHSNVRAMQYIKAMNGNIPMLTLLGREWLGQGKDQEKVSPYEDILALRHENMMLRAQILNASQTNTQCMEQKE